MNNVVNEHQSQVFMLSPREREYLKGKFKPEKKDYERRLKCNIRRKAKKGWGCLQDFALIVDYYLSKEKLRKELCEICSSDDNSKIETIGDLYQILWKYVNILDRGVKFANLQNIPREKTLLECNAEERRRLWRFWKLSHGFDNLSSREIKDIRKLCKKLIQYKEKKKGKPKETDPIDVLIFQTLNKIERFEAELAKSRKPLSYSQTYYGYKKRTDEKGRYWRKSKKRRKFRV